MSTHELSACPPVGSRVLFYLRNRVVACVMTKENKNQRWLLDTEPQLTIANMGKAIIAAFGGVPPAPASS